MGGLSKSIKKGKFVTEIFFSDIDELNEVLKILEKLYLLMEKKLIKTKRNKRSGGSILQIFIRRATEKPGIIHGHLKITR